jgi:hypothetical protein
MPSDLTVSTCPWGVVDEEGLRGMGADTLEGRSVDAGVGFGVPDLAGQDDGVDHVEKSAFAILVRICGPCC